MGIIYYVDIMKSVEKCKESKDIEDIKYYSHGI